MESLTNREREVAALAARGLSNHEIAEAAHQRPAATTDDA
jgi:DNA-binding NarL/FixJ family response regulator